MEWLFGLGIIVVVVLVGGIVEWVRLRKDRREFTMWLEDLDNQAIYKELSDDDGVVKEILSLQLEHKRKVR